MIQNKDSAAAPLPSNFPHVMSSKSYEKANSRSQSPSLSHNEKHSDHMFSFETSIDIDDSLFVKYRLVNKFVMAEGTCRH